MDGCRDGYWTEPCVFVKLQNKKVQFERQITVQEGKTVCHVKVNLNIWAQVSDRVDRKYLLELSIVWTYVDKGQCWTK